MLNAEQLEIFWSFVHRGDDDSCWPWLGNIGGSGYGRIGFGSRRYVASRLALGMRLGRDLSRAEKALHRCDNPLCVNPNHLFVGTDSDNRADCVAKGRTHKWGGARAGSANPSARLSEAQVAEMRTLKGLLSQRQIAARYGVSRQTVTAIMNNQRWRHG